MSGPLMGRQNLATHIHAHRLKFPYKDAVEVAGATVSFQYVTVVQRYDLVANDHGGNEVIIKFAKRYSKQAHDIAIL